MKNLLKSTILLFVVLLISNTAIAQKSNQKAVIKTTLNCDHCKKCETCGLKFKTELLKIKGIKMYELDDKKMTFTIYYNAKKTTLQAIKEGISKLGYDADDVKATPDGLATLDGCCKV
jgi:periplasmic mercuric ion binding protein